jgi:hypothetical protein
MTTGDQVTVRTGDSKTDCNLKNWQWRFPPIKETTDATTFRTEMKGPRVHVSRADVYGGWNNKLEIKCCATKTKTYWSTSTKCSVKHKLVVPPTPEMAAKLKNVTEQMQVLANEETKLAADKKAEAEQAAAATKLELEAENANEETLAEEKKRSRRQRRKKSTRS